MWKEWLAPIQPGYYGNKLYQLENMLRLYLLQNLHDMSGESTVVEAIDSRGFQIPAVWNSAIMCPIGMLIDRFQNLLAKNGLKEKLFAYVFVLLTEQRLFLKTRENRGSHHHLCNVFHEKQGEEMGY